MTDAVPRTSAGLRVVAFVFAAFGLFWGGQAVATADVEHALHLSHGGFGVLLSVALAGAAVSNAVFGSLSERLGTQALLASALVVWSAVLVVGSLVRPPWALGLALVGVVATAGAVDVVMNVAATAALAGQPGRLVRFHGLFNAGAAVGALAMGVVLRAGASWRWMWLASGLVVAAGAVACRRVELPAGQAGEAHSVGQSIRALRAEGLVLLAIAFATAAMVEGGIETWGVLFLRERVGTGVLLGAGAAVAGYAVATLARISLGQAIGAAGPARGVAMGAALASAGLVVLAIGRPAALAAVWAGLLVALRGPWSSRFTETAVLRTFRSATPGQLLVVLALKSSTFLLALLVHSLALPLFGIHIPTLRLLAFLPIVFMVAALPLTVAHLGTSQAAWIYFFNDYAPEADLLAYSLAAHLTFMLANGTLGLIFLPKAYADLFVHGRRDDIGRARPVHKATSV